MQISGPQHGCRRLHLVHVNLRRLETDSSRATDSSSGPQYDSTAVKGEDNRGGSLLVDGGEADESFSGAGADSKATSATVEDGEDDEYHSGSGPASKARFSSDIKDTSSAVSAGEAGEYTSGVKRG